MKSEIQALLGNKTSVVTDLPTEKKPIGVGGYTKSSINLLVK